MPVLGQGTERGSGHKVNSNFTILKFRCVDEAHFEIPIHISRGTNSIGLGQN